MNESKNSLLPCFRFTCHPLNTSSRRYMHLIIPEGNQNLFLPTLTKNHKPMMSPKITFYIINGQTGFQTDGHLSGFYQIYIFENNLLI